VAIDARVPNFEGWWDVPVAEVSGEQSVQQARTAYERAKERQRIYV
jgi:3D-(3,5/4)-trihydroxycyclohexane-1,2-dione acylhydrolase (decyclizing)